MSSVKTNNFASTRADDLENLNSFQIDQERRPELDRGLLSHFLQDITLLLTGVSFRLEKLKDRPDSKRIVYTAVLMLDLGFSLANDLR
ncbi:hypothetical protein GALMADRAFT_253149 [Galerina marginata CBS 339.88]|uniref:Uncharacterized protein n=1 Tax=Galerina marginata (strain CBS 339.88) TaxID=685588 RepID=A0A067SXB0_GALM3|nr:hypothetical protein GALMADRAFT_253149 [Galerina marginata CBS 339.88]